MRKPIAGVVAVATALSLGVPAYAAVSSDDTPIAPPLSDAPGVEHDARVDASIGSTGDGDPECHTVEKSFGDDAVGGTAGQTVCVSPHGLSVSAWSSSHASSGNGSAPTPPGDEPGRPVPPSEDDIRELIEQFADRIPATALPEEEPGGDEGDEGIGSDDPEGDDDLYHQIVEDVLGLDVYEDEVCDDRHDGYAGDGDYATDYLVDEYAHGYVADCWVDDYLVGEYVRNYLLDYVDDQVPVDLTAAKGVAREVIDTLLGVTNAEGSETPEPPVPAVPESGTPSVPQVGRPDLLGDGADLTEGLVGIMERSRNLQQQLRVAL